MAASGWIGVDLDGTLAKYEGWKGVDHIGDPIPLMAQRVFEWLRDGIDVRIFTARVSSEDARAEALPYIESWLTKHFGRTIPVTHVKDFAMIELWDDRCIQVEPNTGRRMDGR